MYLPQGLSLFLVHSCCTEETEVASLGRVTRYVVIVVIPVSSVLITKRTVVEVDNGDSDWDPCVRFVYSFSLCLSFRSPASFPCTVSILFSDISFLMFNLGISKYVYQFLFLDVLHFLAI